MELSGYDFRDIYSELGLNQSNNGCVMLDTEPLPQFKINEDILYYSDNPDMKYVRGQVSEKTPHVTLLYGLMPGVRKVHVDRVLDGWEWPEIKIKSIGHFDPELPDDPYYCVVAHVDTENLIEAHQRLSFLPHINTYKEYKAHLTIAYIDKRKISEQDFSNLKQGLINILGSVTLKPVSLNYGSNIGD